jgi:D-alanine-D-alanine ligase
VAKAHHRGELRQAIEEAAALDLKILVEKAIQAREIECGVLGNEVPEASVAGEVTYTHEFYDYEAKYQDDATEVTVPADLPESVSKQVRSWAVRAFQAIDACGMARVDFFLERGTNRLYLNEINTIPGFTPRSMFPMLWAASGVSYPALIDRLIVLALQRRRQRQTTQGYGKNNV